MEKYLEDAIADYERNIESGHSFYMDATTLMAIEDYYEKENRQYDAERILRFAEKLHPHNNEVIAVRAFRLKNQGKWTEAKQLFQTINDPNNHDVILFNAEWYIAKGDSQKAEELVKTVFSPEMTPDNYEFLINFADILIDYGFITRVIDLLQNFPKSHPLYGRSIEILAEAHYHLQEYDKSIEYLNQLLDNDPYNALTWVQLANVQQKYLKMEDCLVSCNYALAINPHLKQALAMKTDCIFSVYPMEEAIKMYKEMLKLAPNSYELPLYALEKFIVYGIYEEAEEAAELALRLCPIESYERHRIIQMSVITFINLKKFDKANELFETSILYNQNYVILIGTLADLYSDCGYSDEIEKFYIKILEHPSCMPANYSEIVYLLYKKNFYTNFRNIWNKLATFHYPQESATIYNYFVKAFYELKQRDLFVKYLNLASELTPDTLISMMEDIYHTSDINELIAKAKADAETW